MKNLYCLSNFVMNSILNWHPATCIGIYFFYIHWRKSREDFTEHDEAKNLNLNWFFDWRLSCRRSNLMLNLLHNYAINLQVISRGINLHANSQRTNFVAKTFTNYNQPRKLVYYVNLSWNRYFKTKFIIILSNDEL